MSTIEIVGDPNSPTSTLTTTKSGAVIDLQNLPGMTKLQLIQSNELEVDQFIVPSNMPGRKLKVLREAHRGRIKEQLQLLVDENTVEAKDYKVGEFVSFSGKTFEVLKVDSDRVQILIKLKGYDELKKAWINKSKVSKG